MEDNTNNINRYLINELSLDSVIGIEYRDDITNVELKRDTPLFSKILHYSHFVPNIDRLLTLLHIGHFTLVHCHVTHNGLNTCIYLDRSSKHLINRLIAHLLSIDFDVFECHD